MKYKIKPYGKCWIVTSGTFPFNFYLSMYNDWKWLGTHIGDFDHPIYFNTPEDAIEGLKTHIIFAGIETAHRKKHQNAVDTNMKNKVIVVPPWRTK
jgi:hypothetical protein